MIFRELEQCRSCTNKAVVVLRKKDAYCKDCFLASETHKFRAALGKSKMMKPQDRVLVAFSGSQSSVALLHLLHSGVTEKHHKKILFSVSVLFVEGELLCIINEKKKKLKFFGNVIGLIDFFLEGVLFKKEIEERIKLVEDMKKKVEEYNFPIFISTISETFNELPVIDGSLKINNEYDKQFLELFENVKTISSKEDLLYFLRQKLILKCASQLNCNKIFTAEVGNDLAVKLLSNFSLGRGDQASFETVGF